MIPFENRSVGANEEGLLGVHSLPHYMLTRHGQQWHVQVLPLEGSQQPQQPTR